MSKVKVAIIGSGNIGTDLMIKVLRNSKNLEIVAMVGVDAESDGLARAKRLDVWTTHEGIDGLLRWQHFNEIAIVFDATSASAHKKHDEVLRAHGKRVIDLTPAAIGPFVIPPVNLDSHLDSPNLNMVTCGGQATVPIVAAVSRVAKVNYAEIIASIASKSAGPGTRANIDEFTETTAHALVTVGGAARGKAVIVLNPAEPPLMMRDTVLCLCDDAPEEEIKASVEKMVQSVQEYVPGYRLKQDVQVERITREHQLVIPETAEPFVGLKVSVFVEVEGAAHYLPAYAGNLDIMTSAALRTAERLAESHNLTK
ncbi:MULTISPECIES: acetaldehyde dehydrogenase (acetylating) [Paraburkholderia]|uniref:acetaldehyde dehydrogenase (acetylating) n=1 Tax=Paraburkholderia TaxID=1822464 RepID=UPI00224F4A62|nr:MULTISPECIES: acetaldehyde dehydrogenase (acetylating) [Paraburkholderia]MCX4176989.1 acetaldehyde dehydrogenase (acetylating) [Paraburkholderia madseniana]MDQ6464979.1 acetaldehyde dehydrogenase (acetylating) [Paraburkholderia madseniana]